MRDWRVQTRSVLEKHYLLTPSFSGLKVLCARLCLKKTAFTAKCVQCTRVDTWHTSEFFNLWISRHENEYPRLQMEKKNVPQKLFG